MLALVHLALVFLGAMAAPNKDQNNRGITNNAAATNGSNLLQEYDLLCELKASGSLPVLKYRSRRTGLHVIIGKVEGPVVSGFFTLATETHDDDGLPHTLEHLVFLGSEKYPYKGVLDLLANRCLASGTNAWTDIDHTSYTVQTAGSEGFLNLLPIYLDHLLYPTLTDSGFITEVYHITGEGEDAGVVYSEMQARENSDSDRCFLTMMRSLYPEPSGYRSETGGIMKNLRESTTNAKIHDYHRAFYQPKNLHIVITGQVEPEEVFAALEPIEQKILAKGQYNAYTRPWQSAVPPLQYSIDQYVEYPSDSEDQGLVLVAWRGPSAITQINELTSVIVLMEYLTHSSVSPLPSIFVEVEDPLASSVHYSCYEVSEAACYFEFTGVPRVKVNEIRPLIMDTLGKLASRQTSFDMVVMKDILSNLILKQDSKLETSPHDTLANHIIGDALYGQTCEHLDSRLNKKMWYQHLLTESENYWVSLLCQYFTDAHSVVVRGVPSIAEATRLEEEEKNRIAARKRDLGEEGLKIWKEKVETAKETNEIPPPRDVLDSVPIPGVESINFHPLTAYHNHVNFERQNDLLQSHPNMTVQLSDIPIKFQVDDLHSNFVEMIAVLDTTAVTAALRPYISLLLDLFFESPVQRGDVIVPYEDFVREVNADTLSHDTTVGLALNNDQFTCGPYCSNAVLLIKVEMDKYERGVQLFQEVLLKSRFTAERIKVKANKLLNSIGDYKRSGPKLLQLMFNGVTFKKDSNHNQQSILRQQKFLTNLLERMKTEEAQVLKEIDEVRCSMVNKDRLTLHLATDMEKLAVSVDPLAPWMNFMSVTESTKEKFLNVIPDSELRSHEDHGNTTGFLTGVGSVESAYLLQSAPCVTEHRDWDVPALLTALQYLTQLEGPMWKEIRGKGLAYSYSMTLNPTEGTLNLKLARAAQLTGAYREALNILNSHLNGSTPWDVSLLESGRSSLIYEIIEREAVVADVVQQSVLAYFRRVPHTYNKDLIDRIALVSLEDVKRVALKYFTPLVHPNSSRTVIVCHPSKVQETVSELEKLGHKLQVIDSLEESRFG